MGGKEFVETATFVEVARWRSFVRAADALDVQASVVSRRIAALEARLQVRLLARTTRRVELTEAGEAFLTRCESALSQLDEAHSRVAALAGLPSGRLKLSVPATFGRLYVCPALPDFVRRYPELQIDLQVSDSYTDFVRERVDVAIRLGPVVDSNAVARVIALNRRILVASSRYLAGADGLSHPRDLQRHRCLAFTRIADATSWCLRRGDEAVDIDIECRLRADAPDAPRQAAMADLGIALLGEFYVLEDIRRGHLVRVLPEWEGEPTKLHFLYPSRKSATPAARAFMDFFSERLAAVEPWSAGR